MKKLLIELVIVLCCSLILSIGIYYSSKKYINTEKKNINLKFEENIKNNQDVSTKTQDDLESEKKEAFQESETSNENVKNITEEITPNLQTDHSQSNSNYVQNSSNNNILSTPNPPAPTKEPTVWEIMGLTEDEYNNTPKQKWVKEFYSAKDYGSLDLAFKKCQEVGDAKRNEYGGGFFCHDVLSLSDKLIGYYLDYFQGEE